MNFATAYDLVLMNTWFKKRESHLVTFRNGVNASQIHFILTMRVDKNFCKDSSHTRV